MGWLLLTHGTVCTPRVWWNNGYVLVRQDKVFAAGPMDQLPDYLKVEETSVKCRLSSSSGQPIGDGGAEPVEVLDVSGCFVTPGLIDIHIHGALGYDVMESNLTGLTAMSQGLARFGITSFVPTTVSSPIDSLETALREVDGMRELVKTRSDCAEPLGFHVEGPYISLQRKGAHDPKYLKQPEIAELERLWEASQGFWRTMTLAPELDGAMEAISWLVDHGIVVSLGHSTADTSILLEAIQRGASHCTHLFNGMDPLHHRKPGLVGQALSDPRLTVELIVDTFHVDLTVVRLALNAKGYDMVALVSDGMKAVGLPDGEYELGGLKVFVRNGACRLADGTLASSSVTLDRSVRILVQEMGISFQDAVRMASMVPARIVGVDDRKGEIGKGKDADLVIWQQSDLSIRGVVIRGTYHHGEER